MATRKPGKYDHLIGSLPVYTPDEDLAHQDKINAEKERIRSEETHTGASLAEALVRLRTGTEALDDDQVAALVCRLGDDGIDRLSKALSLTMRAHEQLLMDLDETREASFGQYGASEHAVKLPSGMTVTVQTEPKAAIKDREAFRLWCLAHGYEHSMTLPWGTTNTITKERLINGEPEPDGIEAQAYKKVVIRKG